MCNEPFQALEPCVCVTRTKMCEVRSGRAVLRKMCVRQVSVCTLSLSLPVSAVYLCLCLLVVLVFVLCCCCFVVVLFLCCCFLVLLLCCCCSCCWVVVVVVVVVAVVVAVVVFVVVVLLFSCVFVVLWCTRWKTRVYVQTSPCVPAPCAHVFEKHMCAWCRYIRWRFERTHGGLGGSSPVLLTISCPRKVTTWPQRFTKETRGSSHYQGWEQVENNNFSVPPIIRFTWWSCSTPALLVNTKIDTQLLDGSVCLSMFSARITNDLHVSIATPPRSLLTFALLKLRSPSFKSWHSSLTQTTFKIMGYFQKL